MVRVDEGSPIEGARSFWFRFTYDGHKYGDFFLMGENDNEEDFRNKVYQTGLRAFDQANKRR